MFNRYVRLFFALIFSTCFASLAWAEPTTTANPTTCISDYDSEIDYFPHKLDVQHAKGFTVTYHKHYKIVTVTSPWPKARSALKYVLVQCGAPSPTIPGATVIRVPVNRIATLSSTHLGHLSILGKLNAIVAVHSRHWIYNEAVQTRLQQGTIREVGELPSLNIEQLLTLSPDITMVTGYHSGQQQELSRWQRLGIKGVINSEYLESSPLGRAEWLKFTATFLNKEHVANALFDQMKDRYHQLTELTKDTPQDNRPSVLTGALVKDHWFIAGSQSYLAQLIDLAGGRNFWPHLPGKASKAFDFETVFDKGQSADIWITSESQWTTLSQMTKDMPRYRYFSAFMKGQVYNNNARLRKNGGNDYWESAVLEPDALLADLIKIFHPDRLPDHQLKYFKHLLQDTIKR